jgi:hypothetical protein
LVLEAVVGLSQRECERRSRCARASCCSEPESGGGGHHRCAPDVDGGDDLVGVDAPGR